MIAKAPGLFEEIAKGGPGFLKRLKERDRDKWVFFVKRRGGLWFYVCLLGDFNRGENEKYPLPPVREGRNS
jgi:hypothetical protein